MSEAQDDWCLPKSGVLMRQLSLALCLILGGCASYARSEGALPPGYGVSDKLAIGACGSLEDFRARVDQYNAMYQDAHDRGDPIPLGGLIPEIGQTDCDLLAMLGIPDDTTLIQTSGTISQTWTYFTGGGITARHAHLVTLEPRDGQLVVVSIAW